MKKINSKNWKYPLSIKISIYINLNNSNIKNFEKGTVAGKSSK